MPSENRFVRLRVSAAGMRVIDKKGIEAVLKDIAGSMTPAARRMAAWQTRKRLLATR